MTHLRAYPEDEFEERLAERVRRDGYLLIGPGAPVPHIDWRSYPKLPPADLKRETWK